MAGTRSIFHSFNSFSTEHIDTIFENGIPFTEAKTFQQIHEPQMDALEQDILLARIFY